MGVRMRTEKLKTWIAKLDWFASAGMVDGIFHRQRQGRNGSGSCTEGGDVSTGTRKR